MHEGMLWFWEEEDVVGEEEYGCAEEQEDPLVLVLAALETSSILL